MGYTEYKAACDADSPTAVGEVDSGAVPPFPGAGAKTYVAANQATDIISGFGYSYGWTIEFWAKPGTARINPCAVSIQGTTSANQTLTYVGESDLETVRMWHKSETDLVYENDGLITGWHHYVFVREASQYATTRLYVDGVQVDTGSSADIFSPDHVRIGGNSQFAQYYSGDLSQVRLYNAPLSAARVKAHYDAALPPAPTTVTVPKISGTARAQMPTVTAHQPLALTIAVPAPAGVTASVYAPEVKNNIPPTVIEVRNTFGGWTKAYVPVVYAESAARAGYEAAVLADDPVFYNPMDGPHSEHLAPTAPSGVKSRLAPYDENEPFPGAGSRLYGAWATYTLPLYLKSGYSKTSDWYRFRFWHADQPGTPPDYTDNMVLDPDPASTYGASDAYQTAWNAAYGNGGGKKPGWWVVDRHSGPFTYEWWAYFEPLESYTGAALSAYGGAEDPGNPSTDDVGSGFGRKDVPATPSKPVTPRSTNYTTWMGQETLQQEDDSLAGEWHHYAVTSDGLFNRLYIDGQLASQAQVPKPHVGFAWLYLGGTNSQSSPDHLKSQTAFYDTALSQQRIEAHFRAGMELPPAHARIDATLSISRAIMLRPGENVRLSAALMQARAATFASRRAGEVQVGLVSIDAIRIAANGRGLVPQVVAVPPSGPPPVVGQPTLPWRRESITVHTRRVRISVTQN